MSECLFYHLEYVSLEVVLPDLLSKSLARGWNAVVQVGTDDRLSALDAHLWTYDEASFLPHGSAAEGDGRRQPVWLTTGDDNPNGAEIRFFVDGATTEDFEDYQRLVFIFDGADPHAVEQARVTWKAARGSECDTTYWRQDDAGRWTKQG